MWPIPALEHKFVSVLFSPQALVCCWIESFVALRYTPAGHSGRAVQNRQLILRAYKRYPLDNLELANFTLFNPTIIKKYISSFLNEHNLQDAFVAFSLHGPAVTEQFIAMPTSTPHRTDFKIVGNARSILWEYRYLYPHENGQFMFYVYTVPRSLILQYQLLAIGAQCNLITVSTHTTSLLSAYQYMFGSAFRRSQLAVDMKRCNNAIETLISTDAINRMVTVGTDINVAQERLYLAAAVGLLCSERIV